MEGGRCEDSARSRDDEAWLKWFRRREVVRTVWKTEDRLGTVPLPLDK